MTKVAFLESRQKEFHSHRVEYFPFLLAAIRELGWEGQWWVVNVPDEWMHLGTRYTAGLPPATLAALVAELRRFEPEMICFHDRPAAELRAELERAVPGVRLVDLTTERPGYDGRPGDGRISAGFTVAEALSYFTGPDGASPADDRNDSDGLLLDLPSPSFERRFISGGGEKPYRKPLRLALESYCPYRRPLRANRFYAHLDDEVVRAHRGCAFCHKGTFSCGDKMGDRFGTPIVERAIRQVEAHQRDRRGDWDIRAYYSEDSPMQTRLPDFFDAVLDRGLEPSAFQFMMRIDTLLASRRMLEETLGRLRDAGHSFRIISAGAENFSNDENERFNKGIDSAQVIACHEMLVDLEERFPGTFDCADAGRFGGILFTPWTRVADLRANLAAARRIGPEWLMTRMGTRLQLWRDVPITVLARHDGLTVEGDDAARDGEDVDAICITHPSTGEIGWRFADPRTKLIHRLALRIEPLPHQASIRKDDPLVGALRRLRAELPPQVGRDYVSMVELIVDAVEALGPDAEVDRVLDAMAEAGRGAGEP